MIKANFNAYATYVTDSLHQWDLNQILNVTGLNLAVVPEVHFSNANMDRAIVRQATMVNHVVSVEIPNSLLQDPFTIRAYIGIYEDDTFKIVERVDIPIIPRKRPNDYRIEDTDKEIYSFKALENAVANFKHDVDGFKATVYGGLEESNFSDELKLHTIKDYVTPQMFGAKGDGVTDDTEAIQNAIDNMSNVSILYFPRGVYAVSDVIVVDNDISICSDNGARIVASSEMSSVLTYNVSYSKSYTRKITDITIDCNAMAEKGLNIVGGAGLELKNILVLDPISVGIDVNSDALENGTTYEIFGDGLTIRNRKMLTSDYSAVGLYVRTADCSWKNIVTVNMSVGVKCTHGSNFFNHVHPWVNDENILPQSVGIRNEALGNYYSDCYLDTLYIGFVSNCVTTLKNSNFRNADSLYQYYTNNPIFISAENDREIYANNCYFENAVNFELNPIIAQGYVKIIDPKFSTPLYSVDNPLTCVTTVNRRYACRFGTFSMNANSYHDKELTIPNVQFDDSFTWVTLGGKFPDGVIPNVYLKENSVCLRLFNTTDAYISENAPTIYLTIMQRENGQSLDYEIIQ